MKWEQDVMHCMPLLHTSMRCRSHSGAVGGGEARQEVEGVRKCEGKRCEGCERHSECLGTHKYRYHLSNEALALNGLGRHRKMQEKKYLMVRKIYFLIVISEKVKAGSIFRS